MNSKLYTQFLVVTFLVSIFTQTTEAQDWPRWRGPNQDDKSSATQLLQEWPADGPEQVWVFEEGGLGYAGFSIVGDKLLTMGLEEGEEFALCLNAETGEKIWQSPLGKRYKNKWGDGPRSTPTVDGDKVYLMAALGDLVCLNLNDGEQVWSVSMTKELGGSIPNWGYSESPLVDGDHVFCTPGGELGALAALNKETGEKVWQSAEVTTNAHYSSILLAEHNDEPLLVQLLQDKIVGVDPADGSVKWESDWPGRVAVIPSPIYIDGKVYVTSGYSVGNKLIELENEGDPTEVYMNKTMTNHHGGIVLLDEHIYGYSDGKGFVCQSLETGKLVWNEKKKVKKGAVCYAENRFYFIEEKSGNVLLIEANNSEYVEHGRFALSPQTERRTPSGRIWVHPVIANGKLYLRDQELIHCYDISAGE